jgi:D-glycero-D-manno-heptose 1,7-bisphosphate phosphatase
MIGDRISDIKCGKRAGCKTILVKTGDGEKTLKTIKNDKQKNIKPDFVSDDLLDAAKNYIV